jgi:glycosyltransferase involved in cell wall biosynthesis
VADSVSGIVETVEVWLADPATAREMGGSGRERVEAHFTWDAVMDRFRQGISAAAEKAARL